MELRINNQTKQFPTGLTVQELLHLEFPNKQNGIAIAINNRVIPKSEWATHILTLYDELLIITATQGG
ncbi:sulfur carrier protein ThiS [Flavobacterium kingsejongi]|uniref:Thiamine biosynthesis protein ThiS n=1 Tax=Flavobacterium kingsejongi TaxID=1678728 RepID=A0A2S1LKN1_9FLAO|nr:sulfur carrier protein ThiS [Flavobacterium kingsejongi]AWG24066.1 thiamine biosynthesis protein ThiS [Flavobacterium kingsejongi]